MAQYTLTTRSKWPLSASVLVGVYARITISPLSCARQLSEVGVRQQTCQSPSDPCSCKCRDALSLHTAQTAEVMHPASLLRCRDQAWSCAAAAEHLAVDEHVLADGQAQRVLLRGQAEAEEEHVVAQLHPLRQGEGQLLLGVERGLAPVCGLLPRLVRRLQQRARVSALTSL